MSTRKAIRRRARVVGLAVTTVLAVQFALIARSTNAFTGYTGTPSAVFGAGGSGNGQFASPLGVAVDNSTGDVYVVDQGNNRIEKFDAEGKYLSQITGSQTPAGSLAQPRDIAVDNSSGSAKGDVYVTDVGHSVIDVFSSAGTYLSQIVGAPTSFAGALYGVAVDASGNVWVYDSTGNVDEFSDTGSFLTQFNTGRGADAGFAVDSSSNVYLLFGCGCVGKYSASGTQLAEWGSNGTALAVNEQTNNVFLDAANAIEEFGAFGEPYGVPVDVLGSGSVSTGSFAVDGSTGTVYVSRSESNTIAVFKSVLLPDVTTGGASEVAPTSAKLEGVVNPDGQAVASCVFEYGPSTAYGQSAPCASLPSSGSSPIAVSASLSGLMPVTAYHYRLVAGNANGPHEGAEGEFTTRAAVPAIGAPQAPSITRVAATLGWMLNPENSETSYQVLYGMTSAYGEHTESGTRSGYGEEEVVIGLSGLAPETTYHYALQATNQGGTVTGPDETLTTGPGTPPTALTGGASEIALTSATVSGTIDPEGLETSYEIDFGADSDYGTSIYGEAGVGTEGVAISAALQNLAPGTTYHYRIVAINSDGKVYGVDQTFTTPVYSNPIVLPSTLPLVAIPAIAFPAESKPAPVKRTAAKKKRSTKHKRKVHRAHKHAKRRKQAKR
jgi:DNA-binding beta-propeller fold protein YncE